ncbi:RNA-dependent RNA polymerase [Petunia exserta mitovirus 1]|uniref:RNA-dependent RNA polymerase n=1 Tax=Petunia exserta mitovirus 1 TaxID=2080463 RepID=A0ABM9WIL8_9VIRU|nr:RNA-dependent RNA polymerase [Petunia exserta mitovirus 1]DAB41744.1 TPA_inf: RNA-dependent RNA polymerase [Petunia exserta mitovirus 1]
MNIIQKLFCSVERIPRYSWRSMFEHARRLRGHLLRVPLVVTLSMSREIALASVDFSRRVLRLRRKSGLLFTALYLKQCAVSLQRHYAGSFAARDSQSVSVSLTRSGIPRIIPKVLRKHIKQRSDHGDILVRIYLSWFSLAKLVELAPKVSKATFTSIATPSKDIGSILGVLQEMKDSYKVLQPKYLPHLPSMALEKGMRWRPTWKSTPLSYSYYSKFFEKDENDLLLRNENIFVNLKAEIASFMWNICKIHSIPDGFFSPAMLWYPGVLYPHDYSGTRRMLMEDLDRFEAGAGPQMASTMQIFDRVPLFTGRLAQVIEGGGKRRIFAICNHIKQQLLTPVHQWASSVLRTLRSDGTYDQELPLRRLRSKKYSKLYSFDLKSATDRWPLSVIYTLQCSIWGDVFASSVVNSTLGLNTFKVGPPLTKKVSEIAFLAGQPLGYLGSWSLFALSHHYLVWLAAEKVYPGRSRPFWEYALLGDDILIADEEVGKQYAEYLERLGVTISIHKSIISNNGSLEFAKRFWTKLMQVDLSPVSLKSLLGCKSTIGLCQIGMKYGLQMSALQRLAGAGYRVRSRLMTTQSKRWERIKAVACKSYISQRLSLEWWIGRGKPLDPYLRGKIIAYLRKELKPKEIQLIPKQLVLDGEHEILERTVVRHWMEQWLRWLSWYHTVANSPEVTIDQLMEVPMCATSWKRTQTDLHLVKFGLIWKMYDMAGEFRPNDVKVIELTSVPFSRWIYGGYKGDNFIMAPVE